MLTFSEGYPPGGSHTSTWYLVGDFDGRRFRPTQAKRLMDDGPDFYASQSWSNVPSESKPSRWQLPATRSRSIVIAWMNNWNYAQTVPTRPWRGHMTVPRELAFKNYRPAITACSSGPLRSSNPFGRPRRSFAGETSPFLAKPTGRA